MTEDTKIEKIELESGTFETTLNNMFRARKPWEPTDPRKVTSFMPGSVVEFRVKLGDNVKRGQSLMLFRAMKMNNNILAPLDGKVKAINVAIGENVAKNVVMIELE